MIVRNDGGNISAGPYLADLNPQTGQINWQYSSPAQGAFGDVAIGPNGPIYVEETDYDGSDNIAIDVIDGTSGAVLSQVPLPTTSSIVTSNWQDQYGNY